MQSLLPLLLIITLAIPCPADDAQQGVQHLSIEDIEKALKQKPRVVELVDYFGPGTVTRIKLQGDDFIWYHTRTDVTLGGKRYSYTQHNCENGDRYYSIGEKFYKDTKPEEPQDYVVPWLRFNTDMIVNPVAKRIPQKNTYKITGQMTGDSLTKWSASSRSSKTDKIFITNSIFDNEYVVKYGRQVGKTLTEFLESAKAFPVALTLIYDADSNAIVSVSGTSAKGELIVERTLDDAQYLKPDTPEPETPKEFEETTSKEHRKKLMAIEDEMWKHDDFGAKIQEAKSKPNRDSPASLKKILAEAIDYDDLEYGEGENEDLLCKPDGQTPYTGWSKLMYRNGQVENLEHYKDGKLHGLEIMWYENGQKSSETNYKAGKKHGLEVRWYIPPLSLAPGELAMSKTNYKNGEKHGLQTWWDKEGNIIRKSRFENGEKVETIK